ncbi:COG4315 family predicted lipoprotein [Pseudoduganella sp. OTU4001]|uniref:COG4315 family predicted lipoprotein n=1 Tax=Pseudoduganella sp. OTU4001 TaxID=3043854 RepID=UPI00313AE572
MKSFILITAALLSSSVFAAEPLKKADDVYVDGAGMTVYTFDKDVAGSGKSVCVDACLKNWPAVPAGGDLSGPWSAVTRDDGTKQLAYKGKPLYLFVGDKKAGDRNGDNMKDVWHIVKD